MSFLYPLFLVGGLAIALPIVLHLLRRDVAPEVPFSAVRLLGRTPLEQTRRRRLRELLLLAARVAALLLLAAAFARPYFADAAAGSRLHIVAIDRSYSMDGAGRFARALDLAREAIDASDSSERVAVIAFDDRAEVIAPPDSAGHARAALDGLRPGSGGTRYQPVVVRAIELSERGAARLSIVSDLQRAGWEGEEPMSVPGGLQVEVVDAGAPPGNAAVVGVRRTPDAVVATIRNEGSQARAGTARVLRDGKSVASAPFSAPAGGTADVSVAYRAPARGDLAVDIDDRDGYPADDTRYLVLDAETRPRTLVVGPDGEQSGFYLTRALQAGNGDEAFDVQSVSGAALGRIAPEELARSGAVLLLSTKSLDRRARDMLASFVRAGGGLLVAAAPDVEPSVLASVMGWGDFSAVEQSEEPMVLAATDLRHPIFRPFGALAANLGQVRFSRVWRVRGAGWEVAARFSNGAPALLERREGDGRVVVFASDLDRRWNDFPLHPAFVPFAVETVRHLTTFSDARREYTVAEAPPGAKNEPGVYTLPADKRRVAVNVDVRESVTARVSPEEFTAMVQPNEEEPAAPVEQRARQAEERQNLWRYGLILMLGALIGETVVGRGR
ncbi:MAG: vWA domain-containing protein [Vicinamibacterales bacterium]